MDLFRELNVTNELEFRQWARENYIPGGPINHLWHPTVVDECNIINKEQHGKIK